MSGTTVVKRHKKIIFKISFKISFVFFPIFFFRQSDAFQAQQNKYTKKLDNVAQ